MIVRFNQTLILLLVISKLMSSALFGQDKVDYFEDNPFTDKVEAHLLPRKASAAYKNKVREAEGEEVELMYKHMSFSYESVANLRHTKRDLKSVPNIQENDEIYEMSHLFPNCEGRDDLWVVYNATLSTLIANVDSLLRASVNDYVYRVEKRMPKRLKFSLTYIEVDNNVPLNIDSLNKLGYKLLFKRKGMVKISERAIFDSGEIEFELEPITYSDYAVYLSLIVKSEYDMEMDTVCRYGESLIQELGISEGNKKRIIIAQFDQDDLTGNTEENEREGNLSIEDLKQDGVEDVTHLLGEIPELPLLLGHKGDGLLSPPRWMKGSKNDVVYDLTETLLLTGIPFEEDQWIYKNETTGQVYFRGSSDALKMLEDLVSSSSVSYPVRIDSVITFYEVDSVINSGDQWNLQAMLSAKPILLGRVGYSARQSEGVRFTSELGTADITMILGHTGVHIDCNFNVNLKLEGRKIHLIFMTGIKSNRLSFFEVGEGNNSSRKIIMMVDSKSEKLKYKRM